MASLRHPRRPALPGVLLLAALATLGAAAPAQAFLEDKDARKAIVDLRTRVTEIDEAQQARNAEAAAASRQLAEQVAALGRSLLALQNQIEALRGELARVRGSQEQIARDLAELQKRQADAAAAFDERVRQFEPVAVQLDGVEFKALPGEKAAFDEAVGLLRGGDFDRAIAALGEFRKRWPDSAYLPFVAYWQATAHFGKKDFREAAAGYRAFVTASPRHPRAPEALLALANSQAELKDPRSARRTLEELTKNYPGTEAAEAGRQRLALVR
jgi:tol-pal system protein YbgF